MTETVKIPESSQLHLAPQLQDLAVAAGHDPNYIKLKRMLREFDEITGLYDAAIAISSCLNLKEIIWTLHRECCRLIDTSNFALVICDEQSGRLSCNLLFDHGQQVAPIPDHFGHDQGLIRRVLNSQTPLLIPDLLTSPCIAKIEQLWPDKPIRSWLSAPILNPGSAQEPAQGVIAIWSYEPNVFTDRDLGLLSALGAQAAMAMRNARLFEASQRRAMEMAIINDVAHTLASTLDLDKVLACIIENVEAMLNVETGFLLLSDPLTGDLVFQTALGDRGRQIKPFRISKGHGIAGRVALTGKPVMLIDRGEEIGFNVLNLVCVPLIVHNQVIGVLEVMNKKEGRFTQHDLELLSSIASYAAIAIENAQLYEKVLKERDKVIEVEEQARKELARDLHDGPTQLVSGIMMNLEFCKRALESEPSLLVKEISYMRKLAERASHQMRTTLFKLRPLALETQGLAPALQVFLDRLQKEAETPRLILKIESEQPDGEVSRQDSRMETAIFAIIQETVNNALKHARANKIVVKLKESSAGLRIVIIDDGCGFEVHKTRGNGLGLVNIRERAELIGGRLITESVLGRGRYISLDVPKAKSQHKEVVSSPRKSLLQSPSISNYLLNLCEAAYRVG